MIVHGASNRAAAYAAMGIQPAARQSPAVTPAITADKVTISDAAKSLLAESRRTSEEQAIQNRLDAIQAKPGLERSAEEVEFLNQNDKRLAAILAKDDKTRTADEVDYMQKARGFVNTMAELTPKEKALYDELIAQGDWEAALGLNLVGLARSGMKGQQVSLPNGRVFDPATTEITADNIRNLFKQMFVDDSGHTDRQFEALAACLERRASPSESKSC